MLKRGGALILYGPWLKSGITTASSNLEFDRQLRERDPEWGLRHVEDFEAEAVKRNFALVNMVHISPWSSALGLIAGSRQGCSRRARR